MDFTKRVMHGETQPFYMHAYIGSIRYNHLRALISYKTEGKFARKKQLRILLETFKFKDFIFTANWKPSRL